MFRTISFFKREKLCTYGEREREREREKQVGKNLQVQAAIAQNQVELERNIFVLSAISLSWPINRLEEVISRCVRFRYDTRWHSLR